MPVRTYADWNDPAPGFMEADLVAHGGPSASGSFVQTEAYQVNSTGSGVEEEITAGASLSLSQVFPNPVNETGSIRFGLATPGKAVVEIFSLDGVKVATLANGQTNAGTHRIEFSAAGLKSGTYSVVLTAGGHTVTRMMTVVH